MEKRFALFLMLAFGILMAHALINSILNPPPPPGQALPGVKAPEMAGGPQGEDDQVAGPAEEQLPADARPPVAERPDQPDDEKQPAEVPQVAAAQPALLQQWFTMGSVDPASGFRMMITLTNRGAAIERVELSSPRFSDLDDRSGYLGHLALADTPGAAGCEVRVVGPGTPAEKAGLASGDVITALDEVAVKNVLALQRALQKTKPGQEVTLSVTRAGGNEGTLFATLTRRPLEVMRPERENRLAHKTQVPPNFHDPASLLLTLDRIGDQVLDSGAAELLDVDLLTANWEIRRQAADEVVFARVLPKRRVEILKRFFIEKVPLDRVDDEAYPGYHLGFEVTVRNLADTPQQLAYRLDGPTGLPTEGWWYGNKIGRSWGAIGLRDMAVQFAGAEVQLFGCSDIADDDVPPMGQGASLMYAGIDAQYFAAILLPQKTDLGEVWFSEVRAHRIDPKPNIETNRYLVNVTCRLTSMPQNLAPRGELRHSFQLFAGPKRPALLAQYGQGNGAAQRYSLAPLVYYGWFAPVAVVMLAILHAFYAVVGNYGIAIIMLTVMVRGMMFPISRKQAKNMAKMQELQPEMKRIAEKYKDMEKRAKAQQEIWRKHKVHPMGGCLPMFIQLPIFIGLYRSLMVDVELRQAPLLGHSIRWCSNLSAPDMLFDWSSFMFERITSGVGIFGLGPYLNILPLITIGMFIWQQKMFMPPPADEQAEMQQKIMKYMMLFMGILFFKVASGLCLYFIASTLWGIAERKMLPKPPTPTATAAKADKPSGAKASVNGNSSGGKKKGKKRHKQKRR